MRENLYYDWFSRKVLHKENGCKIEDWQDKYADFPFALHKKGFPIFLGPDELEKSDEYSNADPHGVKKGLEGEFQKNRVACTLHLIKMVVGDQSKDLRILDIGCGEGHITAKIGEALPFAEISGLDYSVSAITSAVSHYNDIDFCVASAYRPPYNDDYFDIVLCNNVWEHVPDPVALLSQIRRITKPSGHLIISTPNRYRFGNLVLVLLGKSPSLMAPNHVTEYSVSQIIEQLRYGKYTVLEVYSRKRKHAKKTLMGLVGYNIVYPIVNGFLRLISSVHRLEMTVFFLARKDHS